MMKEKQRQQRRPGACAGEHLQEHGGVQGQRLLRRSPRGPRKHPPPGGHPSRETRLSPAVALECVTLGKGPGWDEKEQGVLEKQNGHSGISDAR